MFFFPLRTDRRLRHTPWVNISLIVVNFIVFAIQRRAAPGPMQAMWFDAYMLHPMDPQWYQFFTYQFLHFDVWHIVGNMLFLYVFGNSLEDRLGPIGYLAFYLAGGVLAGAGHCLTDADYAPVLGASGAVAAVTGGFLALFPLSYVTIAYWFVFIGTFDVHSMYLILFSFVRDLFFEFVGGGQVAYAAHIVGNLYGFAVGMALLAGRILPREPYDFLALVRRWNQRRQLRAATARGYSPWASDPGRGPVMGGSVSPQQKKIMELRASVRQALTEHQSGKAVEDYEQLLELDPQSVLDRDTQHELANVAAKEARYATAARAYERFLDVYGSDQRADESRLMLSLLMVRYLNEAQRARPLLESLLGRLTDPRRRELVETLLSEAGAAG